MDRIKLILALIILLIVVKLFGQTVGNSRFQNWHFGDQNALIFGNSTPIINLKSSIHQKGGCASISDRTGELLFYTDGKVAYDWKHDTMPNSIGLGGCLNADMSGIITPHLSHFDKYYIFTVDGSSCNPSSFSGLNYSIVDISLNNGYGSIMPGNKKINLVDSTGGKVISLSGVNSNEYWIVTHLYNKNTFYSFKVTCSGIIKTPVISTVGLINSNTGYMKPNHKGDKIVTATQGNYASAEFEVLQIFEFDALTGKLSNPKIVSDTLFNNAYYYGVEFSPNDSFLYATEIDPVTHINRIVRYSLYSPNVINSKEVVHQYSYPNNNLNQIGSLQLGFDGKVYCKNWGRLDVVHNPNNDVNYNFEFEYISLIEPIIGSYYHSWGLPTFFDVWPDPLTIPDTTICAGTSVPIGMPPQSGHTYTWTPATGLSDPTVANPVASPPDSTTYTLIASGGGCDDTATVTVDIHDDSLYLSGAYDYCPWYPNEITAHGGPVLHWIINGDSVYNSEYQNVLVTDSGTYKAVMEPCTGVKDTLTRYINWSPSPITLNPSDTTYRCPGKTKKLYITGSQGEKWWKNGNQLALNTDTITATEAATYTVATVDSCGYRDTLTFEVLDAPPASASLSMNDSTILCVGQDSVLEATGDSLYQWTHNGTILSNTTDTLLISQTGQYTAYTVNPYGCEDTSGIYIKQLQSQDVKATILADSQSIDTYPSCQQTITFTATDSAWVTHHHWDFGTGNAGDTSGQKTTSFTFPDTGTYEVTLSAWNQHCPQDQGQDTMTVMIHEPIDPSFTAGPPACEGEPVPFDNQTQWSAQEPINWVWRFGGNDTSHQKHPTYTYSTSGLKTVTLEANTSVAGCSDTLTQQVTISGHPTASAPSPVYRCGDDTATIDLEASNYGTQPDSELSYQWTPTNNIHCDTCQDAQVWPPANTPYQVTVTNAYGCEATAQSVVVNMDKPIVEAGPDQQICEGGSVTLQAQVSPAGGYHYQWQPPQALSATNIPDPEAFPSDTTTYTVTATNPATGCQGKDSVTVYPSTVQATATATEIKICTGDTTQLQANTQPDATYLWEPNYHLSDPAKPNPQAWPTEDTIYTLTITDTVTQCSSKDTVRIETASPQPISITGPKVICQGGQITLTSDPMQSYNWQPAAQLTCPTCQTITISPTQTTTYSLTATDGYGCQSTAIHQVEVKSSPELEVSSDTTICPGTSATLDVTGGDTIRWQPATTLSCDTCRTPEASPWSQTTYTVTTQVAGGCTDTAEVTVDVLPAPNDPISGFQYDLCLGDTLQLNASGGKTYEWIPKQNITGSNTSNPKVYPDQNTTYTLTMTYGPNDCPWQDSVKVNVNQGEGTLPEDTTICKGQSATLTATGFDSYQWQSNANLPCTSCNEITVSPQQTTDYTLTATSNTGCQVDKTVTVTVASSPQISISGPDSLCANTKDTLTASGAQNYQWYPTSGIVQSTGEIQPTQTTTYTVEATINGCQVQSTHTVNVKPLPPVQAENDTLICLGESTPLNATGAQSYEWSPDSIVSCTNCPDPIATPTADITYTVTGTGANGCKNEDTVQVDVSPNPIVTVPNDTTICRGDTIQIRALDNNQHQWQPANEVDCPTCDTVTISPNTRTVFTVTAFGPESCTASDTVVVDVQKPQLTASSDTIVCPDDNFTLTASGAQTYEWQPTNQTAPTIETSAAQAQTMTVTGFDHLGCTDTANIQITVHDTINPQIKGDTITCPGEEVTWTVTEGQSAYWPELDTSTMALSLSTLQPLNLSTIVSDSNGCTYTRTKSLSLHPKPTLTTTPDQTIRQYEEIQLEATGAATYEWNPETNLSNAAISKPTFQSLQTGQFTYTVTGYNQFGCRDTTQLIITVEPKPEVAIPNAFSPNGDGVNDRFAIQLPEDYKLLELHIYDRWGNRVFASESLPWDGLIDGDPAAVGTYVYVLKYEDDRGEVVEKQGNVTVVR